MLVLAAVALEGCTSASHPNHVRLEGAYNFRDVGGYETEDGWRVKKRQLYRSDDLSSLTRMDLMRMADIGLARVYDLRSDVEREKRPNRLPKGFRVDYESASESGRGLEPRQPLNGRTIEVFELPVYYEPLDRARTRQKIVDGTVEPGEFDRIMIAHNKALALDHRDVWARFIRALVEPDSRPALVHCAEGKDRTGFAVAMVLLALGVPEETVYEDYLLSNKFLGRRATFLSTLAAFGTFFRTSADDVRPLLIVKREYLEAGLETIKAEYGSYDAYFREGLGLDEATLEQLRKQMLR